MDKEKRCLGTKGLTLIELIVTISILVILSAFLVLSYTNVLEANRSKSDMANINKIDTSVQQILLLRDDAFEDIKPYLNEANQLTLTFNVTSNQIDGSACIRMDNTSIGDDYDLAINCKVFYGYLLEYVGEAIELESVMYKSGKYVVTVTFHQSDGSGSDGPEIIPYEFVITNSSDEWLKP